MARLVVKPAAEFGESGSVRIHFNMSSHIYVGLPTGSGFPNKTLYELLISPMYVACPIHLTPLDLIILITVSKE
jgi:hypothetical protein